MHSVDYTGVRNERRRTARRTMFSGLAFAAAAGSFLGINAGSASAQVATPPVATPPTTTPTITPTVSPTIKAQISSLLSDRQTWSPALKKVSTQLVYTTRMSQGLPVAPGVPTLHTGIKVNPNGTTRIVIRAKAVTTPLLQAVRDLGGTIVGSYPLTGGVYADFPLLKLETLAARTDIIAIAQPAKPHVTDARMHPRPARVPYLKPPVDLPVRQHVSIPDAIVGPLAPFANIDLASKLLPAAVQARATVVDQAYTTQGVAAITRTYGITGTGVNVGVLSTSTGESSSGVNLATAAETAGGLPTSITVVEDGPSGSSGEGTAMMEDVYALAPGANLFYATAINGEDDFANNIITLQSQYGCHVICDDVIYGDESPFSDGMVAQAVNTVVNAGALYFSASGNWGHNAKDNTSHTYEGDFTDAGESIDYTGTDDLGATVTIVGEINAFGTDDHNDILDQYATGIELMWSDPYYEVDNHYEMFTTDIFGGLYDAEGDVGFEPWAEVQTPGSGYNGAVYVVLVSGSARALHMVDIADGYFNATNDPGFAHVTSGSTFGHMAAANAFSVAAAPVAQPFMSGGKKGPYPGVFTANSPLEGFSTDGSRRIFYTVNQFGIGTPYYGTGGAATSITPGNYLFGSGGGTLINKPDFSAGDGNAEIDPTGELANEGLNPFYGTSCATPHAAAMAALLSSYNYASGGTTITGTRLGLSETRLALQASPFHTTSPAFDNNTGYGFINIPGAITYLQKFFDPSGKGVTVSGVGTSAITVTWQTEMPSTSVVYYGQSTTSTTLTAATTGYTTTHSVTIPTAGMNATQAHYFRVNSVTPNGGVAYFDTNARVLNAATSVGKANIILANLQLTRSSYSGSPAIAAAITLTNAGSGAAADVQLTGATLGSSVPSSGALSTTNPFDVGAIASTKSQTVTLYFPAQASGTTTTFTYSGVDGNGASFSGTVRVALP